MVSARSFVVALTVAIVALVASAPAAEASYVSAVCVTTTQKCCYTPYLCGVIIKTSTEKVAYDCSKTIQKKVEVPCPHGGGHYGGVKKIYYTNRSLYKCYAIKTVVVVKTCYKLVTVKKFHAKVCYKESCSVVSVSGTKPTDGVVGSGYGESTVGGDPSSYFKSKYGIH